MILILYIINVFWFHRLTSSEILNNILLELNLNLSEILDPKSEII
jgi:hypothetical protein